jgi:hypothetical protein
MPDPAVPSIHVFSQRPFHGTVVVQDAVSPGPGWVVIRDRLNGRPGPVVGYAPVEAGVNRWIRVAIRVEPPLRLYAALHVDAGRRGSLELPAPDEPATSGPGAEPVIVPFLLFEPSRFLEGP